MSVYMVVCLRWDPEAKRVMRDRTWGYYVDFARAEESILGNWTDMFEIGYYDHAVIEEVSEGVCTLAVAKQWFFADYTDVTTEPGYLPNPRVSKIDPPKWSERVCNWWGG